MRNKKRETEYVTICPRCGSTDIGVDFSNMLVWGYGTPTKYRCRKCDHIANIFPEVLKQYVKKYKENIKERMKKQIDDKGEKVDVSTGFAVVALELIGAMTTAVLVVIISILNKKTLGIVIVSCLESLLLFWLLLRVLKTIKTRQKQ